MTLTITLPPETEQRLRERAAQSGQSVERFVQQLVEREVREANGNQVAATPAPGTASALEEILAPFRQEVLESGMTDDELREFFTAARDEVRAEKRAQRASGQTTP
jgi:plasmid stability protein